ncbi:MAG TPA: DUF2141 domain-containing protein [Allosphingosinicella sp.]|jgi:uncharacterized protein (DUF2141 family)
MICALLAALSLASFQQSHAGHGDPGGRPASLEIEFTGMAAQKGEIHVTLFDSADSWENNRLFRATHVAVTADKVTTRFDALATGRYGMTAFHDLNDNGKLDLDSSGAATEPVAFSNNSSDPGGSTSWNHAAFELRPGENRHQIAFR